MEKFNEFLNEQLKDPELKSEYDLLEAEFVEVQKRIDKSDFSYMKLIKGKTFYAKGGITTRYMIVDDEPIHEYVSLGLASGKLTLVIGGSSTYKTTTTI